MPATVTVIVTTRNSAGTLEACLRSVRAQTLPSVELIVVDNASTDRTVEIARRYADNVQDTGPERSRQRNFGAQLASGKWLVFLDSDMVLQPVNLHECVTVGGSGYPAVIIPEVSKGQGYWAACKALERACYVGDDSIEAARFFAHDLFKQLGGFDEALTGEEDWDLTMRARNSGVAVGRTTVPLIHDEGRLSLGETMHAKYYYGRTMARYIQKHPREAGSQLLFIRPAFVRHATRLARRPHLATGMLFMKSCEIVAGAIGTAFGLWQDRRVKP